MSDLTDLQSSLSIKIAGASLAGSETNYVDATAAGSLHVNIRNNSGTEVGTTTAPIVVRPGDGTNVASIKAASTAPIATDTALVVSISPNSPLTSGAATSALQTAGNASLASIDTDFDVALSTRSSAANQTNGSQKSQIVDGAGAVFGPTQTIAGTNYLPVITQPDILSSANNITTQDISTATTTGFGGQSFIIGNPTAGSFYAQVLGSIQTVMVEISGIWTGTLATEISSDGGTVWTPRGIHVVGTPIFSSNITSNVIGSLNASSKTNVRVRATTAITGTAIIRLLTSDNLSNVYVANAIKVIDGSSVTSTTLLTVKAASTAALATDPSVVVSLSPNNPIPTGTNNIGSLTNVTGTVSLPTGASSAANQSTIITALQIVDNIPHANNAAFSNGVPMMGQLDDTSTIAATEDNVSTVRITAQRAAHSNIRNNAGTEMGTATNPFIVRPGDGTNVVAVKAASTAAVASDPAIVVAISPNNTITASSKTPLTANTGFSVSVGNTSTSFLASNAIRKGLIIVNTSTQVTSYSFGGTAVLNSGLTLYPGGTFVMDEFTFSTAAVTAIAAAAASAVAGQEYQ